MWKHAHLSASLSEWSLPRSFLWLSVASRKKKDLLKTQHLSAQRSLQVNSITFVRLSCRLVFNGKVPWSIALAETLDAQKSTSESDLVTSSSFSIHQGTSLHPGTSLKTYLQHLQLLHLRLQKNPQHCTRSPTQQCCFAPRRHDFAMACATQIPTQIGEQQIQLLERSRWIHDDHRGPVEVSYIRTAEWVTQKRWKSFWVEEPKLGWKTTTLGIWNQQVECLPYVLLVASWTVLDLWTYTFDHLSRPRIKLKAVNCSIETSSNHPQRQPRINNPLGCWKMGGYHWSIRLSLPAEYPLKYPSL